MSSNKLPEKAKFAIIKRVAHFLTPTEVAASIKAEYGIEVTPQAIEHYDPTKNEDLVPQYAQFFYSERKKYNRDLENIPVESRAYRQRVRGKLLANSEKNTKMALRIIDSAAKEAGGAFTNRHEIIAGKEITPTAITNATEAELDLMINEMQRRANESEVKKPNVKSVGRAVAKGPAPRAGAAKKVRAVLKDAMEKAQGEKTQGAADVAAPKQATTQQATPKKRPKA